MLKLAVGLSDSCVSMYQSSLSSIVELSCGSRGSRTNNWSIVPWAHTPCTLHLGLTKQAILFEMRAPLVLGIAHLLWSIPSSEPVRRPNASTGPKHLYLMNKKRPFGLITLTARTSCWAVIPKLSNKVEAKRCSFGLQRCLCLKEPSKANSQNDWQVVDLGFRTCYRIQGASIHCSNSLSILTWSKWSLYSRERLYCSWGSSTQECWLLLQEQLNRT